MLFRPPCNRLSGGRKEKESDSAGQKSIDCRDGGIFSFSTVA